MKKILFSSVIFILALSSFMPAFADKVSTDVVIKERIKLDPCPPGQQVPILVAPDETDQDGNKIRIVCSQGHYLMQYITSTGATSYIGGCFFDSGMNVVFKQIHYDKYTLFSNGTKKGENSTFVRTFWYNLNAPQLPVRTASNAPDYDFEFDPVTGILMKFNTTHNGMWVTGRDYNVINITQTSNKTIANPDDPQKLISYLPPRTGEMRSISSDYWFGTMFPATWNENGKLTTSEFTQYQNNTFDEQLVIAKENIPFVFDANIPGQDIGAIKYSLMEAPDGMTIDQKNGHLTWTPMQGQAGNYNISIKTQDGIGSKVYKFTLPVETEISTPENTGNNYSWVIIIPIIAITIGIVIYMKIKKKN